MVAATIMQLFLTKHHNIIRTDNWPGRFIGDYDKYKKQMERDNQESAYTTEGRQWLGEGIRISS